jgi:hypothetical protein
LSIDAGLNSSAKRKEQKKKNHFFFLYLLSREPNRKLGVENLTSEGAEFAGGIAFEGGA